ncbi:DUF5825 family protein [Actinomadura rubrisoli]|uniref:Uncharacterized protein n=1 Tax=Actinomadura rubrisoli TaxID=2530368 RepID=A0A4R5BS63_9ACTN|nr:DUF5825 family protein [Actinomadura rubrisoli]TDD88849.1 hypothetical protein E1298_14705 [Actinomadura rubrisoli]
MIRDLPPVTLSSAGMAAAEDRPDVRVLDFALADLSTSLLLLGHPVEDSPARLLDEEPLTWLRLHSLDSGIWPGDDDFARLLNAGVAGMTLPSLPSTPELIAFLVRATSFGLPLEWGGPVGDLPCRLLFHLTPPAHGDDSARKWRAAHRYGLCYWRRGPAFAAVQDLRSDPGAHYVIHEPALLDLFHRLADPLDTRTLTDADRASLDELLDAELAVQLDHIAVGLAYRLRRWPTPVIDF